MEVIHSAVTHHFNPIYSHPQQEIITSLKPVSRGVKGGEEESPHSLLNHACGSAKDQQRKGFWPQDSLLKLQKKEYKATV